MKYPPDYILFENTEPDNLPMIAKDDTRADFVSFSRDPKDYSSIKPCSDVTLYLYCLSDGKIFGQNEDIANITLDGRKAVSMFLISQKAYTYQLVETTEGSLICNLGINNC